MNFVDIIVPLPLPKPFTYALEDAMVQRCQIGMRVAVPFGKQKIYTGIVAKIHQNPPQRYEAKFVEHLLDEIPTVTEQQLEFWNWIARYYQCNIGEVLKAALPSLMLLESEMLIAQHPECPDYQTLTLTDDEYLILEALQLRPLTIKDISAIIARKQVMPILHKMVQSKWIEQQQLIAEKYKPKKVRMIRLHPRLKEARNLKAALDELSGAPRQNQLLLALLDPQDKAAWKPAVALMKKIGVQSNIARVLIDKAYIEETYQTENRKLLLHDPLPSEITLSIAQQNALEGIQSAFNSKNVVLLEGVTASGKTAVFCKHIASQLDAGKQVLYLLPEIALTAQMVVRLQSYFGKRVTVYHSKYSGHERTEVWQDVLHHRSNAQLIVGARSALLLPFTSLGLIVVDEEHETSYKQFDPAPRYHARDAAIALGHLVGAQVVLGSATPALETAYHARKGKYGWVQLKERYGGVTPPKIEIIDLKEVYKKKQMKGVFSSTLHKAVSDCLEKGQQIILFQNRRGYAPILECLSCGHTPQCTQCDVALTHHKSKNQLQCHYCGYHIPIPIQCHACGMPHLETKGTGTQQIEAQIEALFPEANVARMDWDTTRGKWDFDNLIQAFSNQEIQILVGTQMLIKGLDFKNVHLVGVLQADQLLFQPDFRAFERSFQMLSQVAGRAGRHHDQGRVLLQTFNPQHPILQQVIQYDYETFFEQQLGERKHFEYPPFARLVRITLKHRNLATTQQAAIWFCNVIKQSFDGTILGPVMPPVGRIRNQYLNQILVKMVDATARNKMKTLLRHTHKSFQSIGAFKSVKVVIDVDPF